MSEKLKGKLKEMAEKKGHKLTGWTAWTYLCGELPKSSLLGNEKRIKGAKTVYQSYSIFCRECDFGAVVRPEPPSHCKDIGGHLHKKTCAQLQNVGRPGIRIRK
jgi:hypothetical protein